MDPETNHQTNHQFRRIPKGERRVRFADTMGMELVSIFLFDLISNYYFQSIQQYENYQRQQHQHHQQQQQKQQQQQLLHQQQQLQKLQQISQQPQPQPSSYVCEFTQPISLISFKERVKINKVHLETCSVNSRAGNISVSCTIRVLNQWYDKSVIVRYTTDEWHTYTDCLASYKPGSCDGWSDKFTSTFSVSNQVKESHVNQRIIFAIRYNYDSDKISWDNNGGLNYVLKKF